MPSVERARAAALIGFVWRIAFRLGFPLARAWWQAGVTSCSRAPTPVGSGPLAAMVGAMALSRAIGDVDPSFSSEILSDVSTQLAAFIEAKHD